MGGVSVNGFGCGFLITTSDDTSGPSPPAIHLIFVTHELHTCILQYFRAPSVPGLGKSGST